MKPFLSLLIPILFLTSCSNEPESLLDVGIPIEMATFRKQQLEDVVYELSFEIPEELETPINANLILFSNISDVSQPLYLDFNASAERLISVEANGEKIETDHRKEHLIIAPKYLKKGENIVKVNFLAGEQSLNRNEDFLYTLLVPDRASTLFPCFDQPDIKANYVLNISAPKDWAVLCGAPLANKKIDGSFANHQFEKTEKMSTYLFSFVAGAFETVNQNPGSFEMQLLYRENDPEKIQASIDEIFSLHQQSIDFLEEYTAYDFPFQKLDFATIPGFQYGGMEHVGAIQYRESSLFLDNSATESRKLGRGKLIAHETAHMWFGDLVTMKWFNDVWMKEVFANFMADKIVNPAFPQINHNLQFVTNHYPSAYSEDRTLGSNPIRQQLDNLKNAGTLYGRIIYNKAPIMMRQLEAAIGKDAFQEGIQEYIKAYANDNADWNNLVEILDSKTSLDMKQWSEVWVNQSGRPILSADVTYDENNLISSLEISQRAEDGSGKIWPQAFAIDLVYDENATSIDVNIAGQKVVIEEAIGLGKPNMIIYNANGLGYGVFPMDVDLLQAIPEIKDDVARAYSYINNYENTLDGVIGAKAVFEVYQTGLKTESNELIARLLSRQIQNLYWKFLTSSERADIQEALENQLFSQLQADVPANIKKTLFNLYSGVATSPEGIDRLYQIWKGDLSIENLNLNEDDLTALAMNLALYQHEKQEEILTNTKATISNPDKLKRFEFILPALSSDESIRDAFVESLRDPDNRAKESWVLAAVNYIHHPLRHESSTRHLQLSLELLEEIQMTGDIFFPKRWLTSTIGNYSSREAYNILNEFLAQNPDFSPVLKNKLFQAADDLRRINERKSSL